MSQGGDLAVGKKIKISIKKPNPTSTLATRNAGEDLPALALGPSSSVPQQHGGRNLPVTKSKVPGKRTISIAAAGPEGSHAGDGGTTRVKRARQSKAAQDDDYEYGAGGSLGDFGAEDIIDPDMLEDYDDDYDVLGKTKRAKGTRKQCAAGGQVRLTLAIHVKYCHLHAPLFSMQAPCDHAMPYHIPAAYSFVSRIFHPHDNFFPLPNVFIHSTHHAMAQLGRL